MNHPTPGATPAPLDIASLRLEFPILAREVQGKPLVYLDNAATSQKPRAVLEALDAYYRRHNANIHRGLHTLAEEATAAYEGARAKVQRFLNAQSPQEVVFTRGTTEAVNLVAQAWARPRLAPGDEVLITQMEHHSNLVPWQIVCRQTGATLRWVPITDSGEWDRDAFTRLVTDRTRLVAINHISNSLGTVNDVAWAARLAHDVGAVILVDGAQATPHLRIDVQALGADFYAFSGHKVYGPTGIGALYGRHELLAGTEPWQGGGEMISHVTLDASLYQEPPHRFEAGTPDIAGAIGLGAAIDFLLQLGVDRAAAHEEDLRAYATQRLLDIPDLRILGTAPRKGPVVSFIIPGLAPYDAGALLDRHGVAIRTGHHCTQPVMDRFGVPGTLRASFAVYNTREEVDTLLVALDKVRRFLLA